MGELSSTGASQTRRRFLHGAATIGVGVGATGVVGALGFGGRAYAGPSAPGAVIHQAATAEALAQAFYAAVLTGASFSMADSAVEQLTLTLSAEHQHLEELRAVGAPAAATSFYGPDRLLSDANIFVQSALTIETALLHLYLSAAEGFAAQGQPALAALAARHAASESQHLAWIGHLSGLPPTDVTLFTDSVQRNGGPTAVLRPFLNGGTGFKKLMRVP